MRKTGTAALFGLSELAQPWTTIGHAPAISLSDTSKGVHETV
ncbi:MULTISPECIES: hypothetical protein [unclassified Exiguobacterium]|nr:MULTISPECIES: hypothetical protein [unclassified Exiguobacterium]MDX1259344.1 hypothetical protein [Exiguobacterium sp. K1]